MKTEKTAIILVVFSTLLTAVGQYFLKVGSVGSMFKMLTNISLVVGLFFYFIGALLLIYSLKKGQLSTIYPIYSLTYIWVLIIAYIFFNEYLSIAKIAGVGAIVAGVMMIGVESHD